MALDKDTVRNIAQLARIHMEEQELEEYRDELSKILSLVEQMNAADTKDVQPLAHPLDRHLRMRVDEVTETDQRNALQSIAPATEDGLYLVPKVIE